MEMESLKEQRVEKNEKNMEKLLSQREASREKDGKYMVRKTSRERKAILSDLEVTLKQLYDKKYSIKLCVF